MAKKQLTTLWQLSWRDRWLLLEATVWLGVARIAILTAPFRRLAKHLGEQMAESPHSDQIVQETRLSRISWAVRGMSVYTPWESACLVQALSAKAMLRCRGITSTLYLGLAKHEQHEPNEPDGQSGLLAHAWLRSGSIILTGGPGKDQYTIVATFAEKSV